ncbi:hypothetical protein E8E13_011119 [Curvularia kusanoi]|uniref:DUF7924 domain-containing protein n=1 Tax=Curvularia kusanoi TaxID=90978 RepID=A0A9P4TKH6_CURKU|nr:hypothetical protein E8E13_011119 [Curvularia kusanoi]
MTQKRKYEEVDKDSEPSDSSCTLRLTDLTSENLLLHTRSYDSRARVRMMPSAAESLSSCTDDIGTLLDFGINPDSGTVTSMEVAIPSELQFHIEERIKACSPEERVFATASRIDTVWSGIQTVNDFTAASILTPLLLFNDRIHDPDAGEHYIARLADVMMDKKWTTKHSVDTVAKVVIDYMPYLRARKYTKAKFNLLEEYDLEDYQVDRGTIAPFLTAQICNCFGSIEDASDNSARDGAAIVNAHCAMLDAAGLDRSAVDTQHWSVTSTSDAAILRVHWCEDIGRKRYHYMKEVQRATLGRGDPRLQRLLGMLRNILDYALGERVDGLKQAAHALGAHMR